MNVLADSIKRVGKILLVMYVITDVLLFLLAVLVQQFGWEQGAILVGISVVYVISCFFGGFLAGKVQKTKKFIWGILLGLMYLMIMLVLTMIVKHGFHSTVSEFVINLLLCLGGGMIGGMVS